ncbi:hypothetical protein DUNSADRAFT_13329 [Dunaliella salina]|uniref:UBC core domain-containing protein n=1 Tax=Dunaliella salina TaxID=3046 RepID=A0ABQ7G9M1_DUNSA|nr:hypothetical protein DUNSADRAFT_13329 [Dunaliella salina]|eukprot:KAF5831300.1 hypothetical protein DUNSADRAFT_13329 [Dunaliella salina]
MKARANSFSLDARQEYCLTHESSRLLVRFHGQDLASPTTEKAREQEHVYCKTCRRNCQGAMDSAFSARRLARDVRAFQKDEESARFISCQQSESDQYTLLCNMCPLTGLYADWIVHMHLTFPTDYPSSPPHVKMLTNLEPCHPNVFGDYICLDMLKKWAVGPYQGWTAAYDLGGILRQLYSFLLVDETLDQDYGARLKRSVRTSPQAKQPPQEKCRCNFERLPQQSLAVGAGSHLPPQPSTVPEHAPVVSEQEQAVPEQAVPEQEQVAASQPPSAVTGNEPPSPAAPQQVVLEQEQVAAAQPISATAGDEAPSTAAPELPTDMLRTIIEHASSEMRAKCAVSVCGELGAAAREVQQMEELRCFYTKQTVQDRGTVLCLPVSVSKYQSGQVSSISITDPSNLLSLEAFMKGHRLSAWNLPVNEVLPVVLNQQHEHRCMAALPQRVASMFGLPSSCTPTHRNLLDVMAKMMNTLVVEEKCPDLGMLLILLLLVPRDSVQWSDLGPVFVRELLARHIRWSAQTLHNSRSPLFPGGARVPRSKGEYFVCFDAAKDDGNARLQNHLQTSITSLRIVSLSVWFGNALVRPRSRETMMTDLTAIKAAYDKRNGLPPAYVFERFHAHAHGVLEMKTWASFLDTLRLQLRGGNMQQKVERLVQVCALQQGVCALSA